MNREEIIVAIPHCATAIPENIRSQIPHDDFFIQNESDLYTDQIYEIPNVRCVKGEYSRIISDPNRAPDELYTEGELRTTGVVMLSFPNGESVFVQDPSIDEITSWITQFHEPFHHTLLSYLPKAKFLFDCHSMFSARLPGHWGGNELLRPNITLGNQYFCSADAETTDFIAAFFNQKGYSIGINTPYPGRYILGTYCSRIGLPGIQIEINRKLYLDEETLLPRETDIQRLNQEFDELVSKFCAWYKGVQKTEEQAPVDLSAHQE